MPLATLSSGMRRDRPWHQVLVRSWHWQCGPWKQHWWQFLLEGLALVSLMLGGRTFWVWTTGWGLGLNLESEFVISFSGRLNSHSENFSSHPPYNSFHSHRMKFEIHMFHPGFHCSFSLTCLSELCLQKEAVLPQPRFLSLKSEHIFTDYRLLKAGNVKRRKIKVLITGVENFPIIFGKSEILVFIFN